MEGWEGWDDYAPFYDWENAQTVGRRDVAFWRRLARQTGGRVLELGCGTGRITVPLARTGLPVVGIDRSGAMLAHARRRLSRAALRGRAHLVRGDIRSLPFESRRFALVVAPYGILQSLLSDEDLTAALSAAARVLAPDGTLGIDLVPDVPRWKEYRRRVSLSGRRGRHGPPVALVESVRQQPEQHLTVFDHEYIEGWGRRRRVHRFSVAFRTLPVRALIDRVEAHGFRVEHVLGDYDGKPWDERADTWVILASRR